MWNIMYVAWLVGGRLRGVGGGWGMTVHPNQKGAPSHP